MSKYKFVIPN